MKLRSWLTAIVGATMAVATVAALPAHADLVLVQTYSNDITSQTGTGGYYKDDGCGSSSSVGDSMNFIGDESHIGVRTHFIYNWSGTPTPGVYSFDITGNIYGSVSAQGPTLHSAGGDGYAASGVADLNSLNCSAASSFMGPGNAFYGPQSDTGNYNSSANTLGLEVDVSSYADSQAHATPGSHATAISSTTVSLSNLHSSP